MREIKAIAEHGSTPFGPVFNIFSVKVVSKRFLFFFTKEHYVKSKFMCCGNANALPDQLKEIKIFPHEVLWP